VAIKGLGGFHLACDATNPAVVAELRRRKDRPDKPFAVMMENLEQVRTYCEVAAAEQKLLMSPAAPIVLLSRHTGKMLIAANVAPRQKTLGVMLPYTPLHVLLFENGMSPLVMTSGNRSSEPIVTTNETALEHLTLIADAFLMHNRNIHIRTDDSVMRVWRGEELPLRRSRGYVPFPVRLTWEMPSVLAVGGEMKNTFCLTRKDYAFMSHHIGEMGNYATLESFESGIAHFERLFRAAPELIVHDLHPDYLASRYALSRSEAEGIPRIGVQHHHAHIASCMVENGLSGERPVIGVCFDGTGYGTDGSIWGGEFLLADYQQFQRLTHFKPMPLPGGDASTRKPARLAAAYVYANGLALPDDSAPAARLSETERRVLYQQIERGINTPLTSSVGRLFDVLSSLLGICQFSTYEGQAAIELEAAVDIAERGSYPLPETPQGIDPAALLRAVLLDLEKGLAPGVIAGRFHNGIAQRIAWTCERVAQETGIRDIVLTGGVFQNTTLLSKTVPLLEAANLHVHTHRRVPPNDGGLALGQAVIGFIKWKKSEGELL
jgi:hydrogenase maturation protein HypF